MLLVYDLLDARKLWALVRLFCENFEFNRLVPVLSITSDGMTLIFFTLVVFFPPAKPDVDLNLGSGVLPDMRLVTESIASYSCFSL